jgi:hypothetical protein
VASNEQDFVDSVLVSYTESRRDSPDKHLLRRAALSAEFALAQYLVKGIAAGDETMISEAEGMLETLASDIAEHGGQAISVEPLPAAAVTDGSAAGPAAGNSGTAGAKPETVQPVTVLPAPAPGLPAVLVTPIPKDESAPDEEPAPADTPENIPTADDTSTAALTVIDVRKS